MTITRKKAKNNPEYQVSLMNFMAEEAGEDLNFHTVADVHDVLMDIAVFVGEEYIKVIPLCTPWTDIFSRDEKTKEVKIKDDYYCMGIMRN